MWLFLEKIEPEHMFAYTKKRKDFTYAHARDVKSAKPPGAISWILTLERVRRKRNIRCSSHVCQVTNFSGVAFL